MTAVYSNHFRNEFHFDDFHTIVQNPYIQNIGNVPRFFRDAETSSVLPANRSWRPLVTSSLAFDYWFGGGFKPFYFHLSTFLWFLVLLALMFALFWKIVDSVWAAAFATALFAVHPAIAETVNYIIQRADLYSTLGVVASLAVWAFLPRWRKYGLYLLPLAAAILCKPPAMVFPAILFFYIWLVEGVSQSGVVANVIREFTADGKLLRTMGKSGTTGFATDRFDGASDVLVAPDGSIFVADGHSNKTNNRILKYDRKGNFLLMWGKLGSGPGEFNAPHGLAMDREGRLYVADRSNSRIQIFDQQGKFLAEWRQFGRPSGIFITRDDMIYVADSLSSAQNNPGFKNGIRWGHISDGKVLGFIPWGEYNAIEAVAVDDKDNIYTGFTNVPNFRRWVKN